MNAIIEQQPNDWRFTVGRKKPKQSCLRMKLQTFLTSQLSSGLCRALLRGAGEDGQLGLGDLEDKAWACQIEALESENLVSVVAGSRNSLAICDDGRLFTWGWNQRGTLGHAPGSKSECIPSQVKALENVKIVQAAIGGWHCLAVDADGCAYAWGGNEYGQCAEPPEQRGDTKVFRRDVVIPRRCASHLCVRQVAAGGTHSVVCTDDGCVWTWGQPWPPGDIKQISTPVRVQGLENVKFIAVGAFHNLALLDHGEVWAWGNNEYGQLGTGDTQPRALPVAVKGLVGLEMADIAAGGWHSMALTPNGEVYAWGRGEHGRLGFCEDKSSKMVPQKIEQLSGETIIQVSCGGTHTVALTAEGRMFSFGRADHGRLGYPTAVTTGDAVELPIIFSQNEKSAYAANGTSSSSHEELSSWLVKYIACGGRHTLALATAT
ncbi:hypothetical protein L7F22_058776 [Adiantum nelumboides]|nr:hypothetical protein [Adiantum nelumboides]